MYIPVGFDRADGVTPLPNQPIGNIGNATVGTPSPAGGVQSYSNANDGSTPTVEEEVDSPEIERAEQATSQHRLKMSWAACLNMISGLGRGTFVRDSFGNVWRILSSKISAIRSGAGASKMGQLSYTAESVSFDSPPDDYQMVPVELGLDILKHPRYSWALLPFNSDFGTYATVGNTKIYYSDIKQTIIRIIQTYRDSPIYPSQDNINGTFQSAILSQFTNGKIQVHWPNPAFTAANNKKVDKPVTWDGLNANFPTANSPYFIILVPVNFGPNDPVTIAISAAYEVISKLWRGEDTPYVVGFEITWSQYYFAPVYENPGGYIESPIGIVPDYFLSPNQDGSNTIFDQMAAINPQCYSGNGTFSGSVQISWLRKADEVEYQRTWFKVTRKWIGSPIGAWDVDIYTRNPRPHDANGYHVTLNPFA